MSTPLKVSSRYQIAVPKVARERLNIQGGDRLLADVRDGLLILFPCPKDYAAHLAGLHREVWAGLDTTAYLQREREGWASSRDSPGIRSWGWIHRSLSIIWKPIPAIYS